MLAAFARAFRTPDLRNKLLFTLFIIAIFRLGATVPTPGVDTGAVRNAMQQTQSESIYQLINLFSGGALLQLSVFALGIMPYITASIILQLLSVVIPRLEQLRKEGQSGQQTITQYTRYLTIGLGLLQATSIVALARTGQLFQGASNQPLLVDTSIFTIVTMVLTMTAGIAVIMWLGELITDRGIGNGMSLLIFAQIIAVFPNQVYRIYQQQNAFVFGLVIAVGVAIMAAIVFVEQAQRRIPVQYAKRMVGRRMYGGSSTYIPLKVNQAGVIPVIFASSLLFLPQLAASIWQENQAVVGFIQNYLVPGGSPIYMVLYFAMIIFFTYFYVAITFNPPEVADNMKKYGGFIPGIRPGRPTAEYLDYVLSRITAPGSLYLGLVAVVPMSALGAMGGGGSQSFLLDGISILIMVGVGLNTVRQIESQLQQRNYEGFLR